MTAQFTYRLDELDSSAVGTAGGKGSSLGELVRAGAPVPPAFVIGSAAFEAFMSSGDHRQFVDDVVRQLDSGRITAAVASETIISHLGTVPVPSEVVDQVREAAAKLGAGRVAVRSSATCEDSAASAWAGQLNTYLDVRPPDVVEKVRKCWLSIFCESALAYSAVHGVDVGQIAMAVVVQQMVASDVSDDSGIACHAAIIARELRKPTLIGTKTATSMIHTGDLVEVDTYAQVVRISEHAGQA